jgi:signal transduction histidine kinase
LREKPRSQTGCIARRMQRDFHHGLLSAPAPTQSSHSRRHCIHMTERIASAETMLSHSQSAEVRFEQVIATSRLFLAGTVRLAMWFEPADAAAEPFVALLSAYVAFAIICVGLARTDRAASRALRLVSHVVDMAVAAGLLVLVPGPVPESLFLLSYPLVVAAFRWGLRQAFWTAATLALVLAFEVFVYVSAAPLGSMRLHTVAGATLPVIRVGYLITVGFLVGYLADVEKRQRREANGISRMLRDARAGAPLDETYERVLDALTQLFRAKRALLVLTDVHSARVFLRPFETSRRLPRAGVGTSEAPIDRRSDYAFDLPGGGLFGVRPWGRASKLVVTTVDTHGAGLPRQIVRLPLGFLAAHRCRRLVALSAEFDGRWTGRVFVFDPPIVVFRTEVARTAQRIVTQVGPALYDRFLLRSLRSRAANEERARIVREFHDGPMQSLLGMEMALAALRRKALADAPQLAPDLAQFHDALRREVIAVRDTFEGVRALEPSTGPIAQDLSQMVSRFGIYSTIVAWYIADGPPASLTPHTRREVLRMVHEALMNVRKHSGAKRVIVRSRVEEGRLTVRVEDDGRGYDFAGLRRAADLRAEGVGPWTILDRAERIHADVTISSTPGTGACLEVSVLIEPAVGVPS